VFISGIAVAPQLEQLEQFPMPPMIFLWSWEGQIVGQVRGCVEAISRFRALHGFRRAFALLPATASCPTIVAATIVLATTVKDCKVISLDATGSYVPLGQEAMDVDVRFQHRIGTLDCEAELAVLE